MGHSDYTQQREADLVLLVDNKIVISVNALKPWLLVPEAYGMKSFMDGNTMRFTSKANRYGLPSLSLSDTGIAAGNW